ncbi:MAG: type II secretion system protein GspN [Polyangiales bacterium]
MSAGNPPISHRAPPDQPYREGGSGPSPEGGPEPALQPTEDRFASVREKLRTYGPWVGYASFFFFALLVFIYWSFPYDRVRDRIIAEFEHSQKSTPGAPKQVLSIGRLEPSWFTGVVLKDVTLTSYPADPSKNPSILRADEIRARVSFGSLFSAAKDVTFSIKGLGGTIDGSITHKLTANPTPSAGKAAGPKYDRTIKMDLDNVALGELTPVRDAIGTAVGGTLKGSIDITYGETRIDKANGTIALEVENFWVSDGKTPFKVPALKAVFGSEDITLPQIYIGNLPVQIAVKNGVARIEKMEGKGKDLDLSAGGQITLRENAADSDMNLTLQFKFNDQYKKKGDSTAGLLLLLDSEPKLRASKRPDGFYALRVVGLLGGSPQVLPASGTGSSMSMPMHPLGLKP